MKIIKIIFIFSFLFFLNTNTFSEENALDCKEIKNIAKKIRCNANLAKNKISSKIAGTTKKISSKVSSKHKEVNSKTTLADWFKKKKNDFR